MMDGVTTLDEVVANTAPDRRKIATAGLVLVRQRPGSAKGVMFINFIRNFLTASL